MLPQHAPKLAEEQRDAANLTPIRDALAALLPAATTISRSSTSSRILADKESWRRAASVRGISHLANDSYPTIIGIQISNWPMLSLLIPMPSMLS